MIASVGVPTTKVPIVDPDHGLEIGGFPPTAPPVTLLWDKLKLRAKIFTLLVKVNNRGDTADLAAGEIAPPGNRGSVPFVV